MPLMTYDEYSSIEHDIPYMFSLKTRSGVLYYFGERHSFDPEDEQLIQIRKFWSQFLNETEDKKRIVFVEGGTRSIAGETERQTILDRGGMGFVTYLASQAGIATHSPEPDGRYERSMLEKEFSREEIQYYYFARVCLQWCRKKEPRPDFEEYIGQYLQNDKDRSNWQDFDFSLESMKKIHENMFALPFDENDRDFLYQITNPTEKENAINHVSRRSGEIRDEYIAKEILRYADDGYSIYAQFGASHAVIQEPLLREILS